MLLVTGVMPFMRAEAEQNAELSLNEKEKLFLLKLARDSIKYFLENGKAMTFNAKLPSKKLEEKIATFVTLTENGELRGCVGHLEPVYPLYVDVIKNSVSAAFDDFRFKRMERDEIDNIKIELSVLSVPRKLDYSTAEELLKKIEIGKDGIIIKYKSYKATFLPQVWEQIPNKEVFLSQLCIKALLSSDFWRDGKLEVYKYRVMHFEEKD